MRMTMLRFGAGGNAEPHCLHGFHPPEHGSTWSDGPFCAVTMPAPSDEPCVLVVSAKPFVAPPALEVARIRIVVDDEPLADIPAMQDFVVCLSLPPKRKGASVTVVFIAEDACRPTHFGQADGRMLGVALAVLAIVETGSALADIMSVLGELEHGPDREIARWAAAELLPWAVLKPSRRELARKFDALNIAGWCQIFRISRNQVVLVAKPAVAKVSGAIAARAALYRDFFEEIALDLPHSVQAEICMCLADRLFAHFGIPVMAFQRPDDYAAVTIPDVEFLEHGYFENSSYTDSLPYDGKKISAVFSGSTTGGLISLETISMLGLPRLRAARHFQDSKLVDFRLPNIVECADAAAEAELRKSPFCRRPRLSWQEHLRHRFLISLDGNGATCSRVALALKSNSALLKYESTHCLFYSRGLRPHVHYVPIGQDPDVTRVVAMEQSNPGLFRGIAEAGSAFAIDYLSRKMLRKYATMLITLYAHFQV